MKCKHCGEEIANDSVYCEFCGHHLVPVAHDKNKKIIAGTAIAGILITLIVLGIWAVVPRNDESQSVDNKQDEICANEIVDSLEFVQSQTGSQPVDSRQEQTGANISMNVDKDCDEAYLRVVSVSDNNTLTTVSSGAQRNGVNDQDDEIEPRKKKLTPKDKSNRIETVSKTKISFDYDKDIPIIEDYNDNINRTVEIIKANPTFGLQIEGYADNTGSEEHQRDLAQRRAYNVKQMFIDKGVPENQISTVTYTVNDSLFKLYNPGEHRCAIFRILVK